MNTRVVKTGLLVLVAILLLAGLGIWFSENHRQRETESETKEADEVKSTNKDIADPLAQVSLGLYIIKTTVSIHAEGTCTDNLSESDDPSLRQLARVQARHCDGYQMAIEDTQELAKQAIINGQPPDTAYLFFTGETEDDWMGLFTSLKRCQKVENIFRETDVPTRSCRDWKKTVWYQMPSPKA